MIIKSLLPSNRSQKGFTLVELLIGMSITALILTGLVTTTLQLVSMSSSDINRIEAVKQVENALHYINRDGQMAQVVEQPSPGQFPLTLMWQEYDETESVFTDVQVEYYIDSDTHELKRRRVSDGETNSTVAYYVVGNGTLTTCQLESDRSLDVQITIDTGGFKAVSETRNMKILLRSHATSPGS